MDARMDLSVWLSVTRMAQELIKVQKLVFFMFLSMVKDKTFLDKENLWEDPLRPI